MQESELRTRVPPGQVVTQGYPILHAGSVPNLTKENWALKIYGLVENELDFNYDQLLGLRHTTQTNDIHCVTSWSKLGTIWEGIKFSDLMTLAKPKKEAHFAIFESEYGFSTNLPLEVVMDDDVMLAFKFDGKDLEQVHGGPVRVLVPKRYFYKSAKWLRAIKLTEHDVPGFWEIRGYSNTADPWKQERYAGLNYFEIVKNRLKAYGKGK